MSKDIFYDKDIREPLFDFLEKLIEKVPAEILWKQAYEELFERDYNTIAEEIETYRKNRRKA